MHPCPEPRGKLLGELHLHLWWQRATTGFCSLLQLLLELSWRGRGSGGAGAGALLKPGHKHGYCGTISVARYPAGRLDMTELMVAEDSQLLRN